MQLDHSRKQLQSCPVGAIAAAMPDADDPLWDRFALRQNKYDVHAATRSIVTVWCDGFLGEKPLVIEPGYVPVALAEAITQAGSQIAAQYPGGRIVRLMLAALAPGGEIRRHRDRSALLEAVHRCHLAVRTNPEVSFMIDDQRHDFPEGVAFEVDNTRPHSVVNGGSIHRVHLICDILPPA
jgi:hypothetical protein